MKRLNYQDRHSGLQSVEKTGNSVLLFAYNEGYLEAYFDTLKKTKSEIRLRLNAKKKYQLKQISINDSLLNFLKPSLKERKLTERTLSPEVIEEIHKSIIEHYEKNGYPFVSSRFKNIKIDQQKLTANLFINKGPLIKYDTLIIKGKAKIKHAFMSNYLNINSGAIYNKNDLVRISSRIDGLQFLKEIKKHEVVFKDNKALVYVYLKKGRGSKANGIIGIQPDNQTGKINITGEVNLQLKNAFKVAETLKLEWRKLQPRTQNLDINLRFPMLFKTPFGIDAQFNLYKRDTTFLDVSGRAGVLYTFSSFNTVGGYYKFENSQILGNNNTLTDQDLSPVRKNHFGITSNFQNFNNFLNPTSGYQVTSDVSFVNRTLPATGEDTLESDIKTSSYEFQVLAKTFIPIGNRNTIKVAAKGIYQWAPTLYRNELFRIGGLNSLRGFDEESINVSSAIIGTIEYRFLLDKFSNVFAFFDVAGYEANTKETYNKDYPFGFGAGINFSTDFGTFSLTYALGKQKNNPIKIRSGKIHFGYINNF